MDLLAYLAFGKGDYPFAQLSASDLARGATLARLHRQLSAAWSVAAFGYHAEALNLLRSAYETGGLARAISHEEAGAAKWLKSKRDWQEKDVRAWLKAQRATLPEAMIDYGKFYGLACAWAHPTAESCMSVATVSDSAFHIRKEIPFDEGESRKIVGILAGAALFACFCARNAFASEQLIDPEWRQSLQRLAEDLTGKEFTHLDRDWDAENDVYLAIRDRLGYPND
jgi:hypothetical protein